MSRKAEIKLTITLDENNVPEEILWKASEAEVLEDKNCEAMFLSMWDKEERNSLIIDLWTKKIQVDEMNTHVFYTIMKMADTYQRATNNEELSNKIRRFANEFAGSAQVLVSNNS